MSYKNDQFYNLKYVPDDYASRRASNNPPFVYPEKTIRTYDHGGYRTTILQRGYMRSLLKSYQGTPVPVAKCGFQFNPTTITQSVTQMDSVLNYFQQTPAEATQMLPGQVNFKFDLIFDRSFEMNNSVIRSNEVQINTVNTLNPLAEPDLFNYNEVDVWAEYDPGYVGVLRDLSALYRVAGQGISREQMDIVAARLSDYAATESLLNETDTGDLDTAVANINDQSERGLLFNNLGNSAFLLPLPVRVMFSSLYMVDGYVTGTDVVFTKFNSAMVPMQCAVTVNMQAQYIGFAREKTFVTYGLEQAEDAWEQSQREKAEGEAAIYAALATSAKVVSVSLTKPNFDDPIDLQAALLSNDGARVRTSMPNGKTGGGGEVFGTYIPLQDPVSKAFVDGQISVIDTLAYVRLYGPYTALNTGSGASPETLRSFMTNDKLMGSFTNGGAPKAGDKDAWEDQVKGVSGLPNPKPGSAPNSLSPTDYYIVDMFVTMTVAAGGSQITGTGNRIYTMQGYSEAIEKNVLMTWPTYAAPSTTSTTTVSTADNPATRPPRPGSVSNVGGSGSVSSGFRS